MDEKRQPFEDRESVVRAVTTLFVATDNRDWPAVARCFAPLVMFDMSSLTGDPAGSLAADEIVAAWECGLAHLEAIHHQVGNFLVDVVGKEATASCYGIAYHYLQNPTGRNARVFVGSYDFHLVRRDDSWRIDLFRFNSKFMDGNPDLEGAQR